MEAEGNLYRQYNVIPQILVGRIVYFGSAVSRLFWVLTKVSTRGCCDAGVA